MNLPLSATLHPNQTNSTLGDYEAMIRDKLYAAGIVNPSPELMKKSLFRCNKDGNGEIDFPKVCIGGCTYGGSADSSDHCT
jgi:hypothetical protein